MPFPVAWSAQPPSCDGLAVIKACVPEFADGSADTPTTTGIRGASSVTLRIDPALRSSTSFPCVPWYHDPHLAGQVAHLLRFAGVESPSFRMRTALWYVAGDHFTRHTDVKLEPLGCGTRHIGTLLFVVPCESGGDLRVIDTTGLARRVVCPVKPGKPTLVWMKLGMPHEVTPVEAGTRWVLKAAVYGTFSRRPSFYDDVLPPFLTFDDTDPERGPSPLICDNDSEGYADAAFHDDDDDW
jgi:hypothetical protein